MIAQRVSAGLRPPMKSSPGGATDSPLLHTADSHSPLGRIPHARFAQDAKTPRQARNGIRFSFLPPFPPSRLRANPSGLNHRRMAAKITESRKRTLFSSDEAAEPIRPRRTMNPPGKPSHHASGSASASVSKTHGEEPGSIPIHLGNFGSPRAVPPGPEGRQTVAQRVSAGFRHHVSTSPRHSYPVVTHTTDGG
jgi:hypothetical protein